MSTDDLTRFDADPDALAWARAKVQRQIDKLREWERHDTATGDPARAKLWRQMANMMDRKFIGGSGCVIAAFDERKPQYAEVAMKADGGAQ